MGTTVAGNGKVGHVMALLRSIVSFALVATLVAGCSANAGPTVTLGGAEVRVFVADDDDERSRGLQGYDPLPDGAGMLFVYDDAAVRTFAMKQVAFPIDVLFVGDDLTITAIEPLDPGDMRLVSSPGPCRYVVELPQGWAGEQGVVVGDDFGYAEAR
jgi:hypothetical protein